MMVELFREIVLAFLVGGAICVIGQLMMDIGKLTPAHTLSTLVVIGALLGALGIYPQIVEFAGAGATLPIISFGNTLVKGALEGAAQSGFWGLWSSLLTYVSAGIALTVFMGFVMATVFRPKS